MSVAIVTWYDVPGIPLFAVNCMWLADVAACTVKYQCGFANRLSGGIPEPMLVTT